MLTISHQDAKPSSVPQPIGLSDDELRVELYRLVERVGSQARAAQQLGVSFQFVSEVLRGNRRVSEGMALQLGFEPIRYTAWRKVAA